MSDFDTLRAEVIAGLKERGWPEPVDMPPCSFGWHRLSGVRPGYNPPLIVCLKGWDIGYSSEDGSEYGRINISGILFDKAVWNADNPQPREDCAPRLVKAIDRLRWVIGLAALSVEQHYALLSPDAREMVDSIERMRLAGLPPFHVEPHGLRFLNRHGKPTDTIEPGGIVEIGDGLALCSMSHPGDPAMFDPDPDDEIGFGPHESDK